MKKPRDLVPCPWCEAPVRQPHIEDHKQNRCPKAPAEIIEQKEARKAAARIQQASSKESSGTAAGNGESGSL
jgi:hypothetical protein